MPFNVQKAFEDITRKDAAALDFCVVFYEWVHLFDDLIDRDKPVQPEAWVGANFRLISMLSGNAFWLAHKDTLLPVVLTSVGTWVDSERFKLKDHPLDRLTSQVLKSEYMNVFLTVAFIIGGWEHMLASSKVIREYHFDPVLD